MMIIAEVHSEDHLDHLDHYSMISFSSLRRTSTKSFRPGNDPRPVLIVGKFVDFGKLTFSTSGFSTNFSKTLGMNVDNWN